MSSSVCLESESTQTDCGLHASEVLSTDSAIEDDGEDDLEDTGMVQRISKRMAFFNGVVPHRESRGTQTASDPLTFETDRLAFDIVLFTLGRRREKPKDETAKCLRRSVHKMMEKHQLVFNAMVNRLDVQGESDLNEGFREMSNELFGNNEVSWSKIIALFAFAARLAQHCDEQNQKTRVLDVASNLSQFAVEKITPFLRQHGGWATLCEAFPLESDYEGKIWHSLVITGLGLTAVATFLALQH